MPSGHLDESLVPSRDGGRDYAMTVEHDGLWPIAAGVVSRAIEGDHRAPHPVASWEISKVLLVTMLC
jgi:hypothetical protein